MGRESGATAGALSLAEPLAAAVLGIALLGERLSPSGVAGGVLLLGGLVLVSALPSAGGYGSHAEGGARPRLPCCPDGERARRRRCSVSTALRQR
ncbi:EamA family transporter [Streptomyces sp. NBC_01197]|uniref:EamA family transporter n=1 Tax=Streptomyces sp. NBC_01197 TaxID=2903768 RepID=UPI002E0D98FE|nr:DMT family transporter [Streptomyces sp. NBC_01197]